MAMKKVNKSLDQTSTIEASPLLSKSMARTSTVDSSKLERSRFTEIKDMESEGNSIRIIIFIFVVIVVGVVAALLVRNAITGSNSQTESESAQNTTQTSNVNSFVLSSSVLPDSNAVNVLENSDYVDSAIINLGDSTSKSTDTSLDKISYLKYTSFSRLIFDINTLDKKLPKTNINFDSVGNKMTIAITNLGTIANDLKKDLTVNDIVSEIRYVSTNNNFVIIFKDSVKYNVSKDGDNLVLNFKTVTEISKPTSSTTTTTQTNPQTSTQTTSTTQNSTQNNSTNQTDSQKPTSITLNNDFSLNKQYIVSSLSQNKIAHNIYYFDNYGSSYQFSWAQKNVIGDSNVPNATAYYDTENPGKNYLIVEISNLTQEVLTANGVQSLSLSDISSRTGVSTAGSNLNSVTLISFANGVAKYRLDLPKKTEFKLWVDKTVDNLTGTISVTIKN